MNRIFKTAAIRLGKLFGNSYYLSQFARVVVQTYDNDRNDNMDTNGEKSLLKMLIPLTGINSVFIDVGANVGDWSKSLVEMGYHGHLIAVDPLAENLAKAKEKLERIGCKKYDLCQYAVSNQPGHLKFYINNDRTLSGHDSLFDMGELGYQENVSCIEVVSTTIDELASQFNIAEINFLKIDVEGNELSVLKGANRFLESGSIEFIQFEFGHAARAARFYLHDIVNFLMKYDYEIFIVKPRGLERLIFTPFIENRYSYINFFMARKNSIIKINKYIIN